MNHRAAPHTAPDTTLDHSLFKPQRQAIALEQRIMFDGAAASAVEQAPGAEESPQASRTSDVRPTAQAALAVPGLLRAAGDAAPAVTVSGAGADVLLGDTLALSITFTNTAAGHPGYAPFIDLFMPATGRDGDDGVGFESATYLGQALAAITIDFDAAGNALHPLARGIDGNPLVISAASVGMRAGDQLVVLALPYGSVDADQPAITIDVTARLSDLADTTFSDGAPDLSIRARGGFQFGNDALDNPTEDPSLLGEEPATFVVHPTVVEFAQRLDAPEGETATGPNFGRTLTVTARPATGQTLTDVVMTQLMPDSVRVTAIEPGAGGTLTSITLADGSVVTDAAEIASRLAEGAYLASFSVAYPTLAEPASTVVSFYVADVEATGAPVIDPASGDAAAITIEGATTTGNWLPLDPRDRPEDGLPLPFSGSGDDLTFAARSLALLKRATVAVDAGRPGLTPGDTLDYALDISVSDYFLYGRNFFNEGSFTVQDQLGDGQVLAGTPTLTLTENGATRTIALVYTAAANADGSTALAFDIAQSLRNDTGRQSWLAGDLAQDAAQQGATTAVIRYGAVLGQSYTPPAGAPHSDINEGDSVGNSAVVSATVMGGILGTPSGDERDGSATASTVPAGQVAIDLLSVNGAPPPANGELRPGDLVTFTLDYALVTGDYEQFRLAAYLPQPLFDLAGIAWDNGSGAGQWTLAPAHTNGNPDVTVRSAAGNAVEFDFGDWSTSDDGDRIALQFTLRVGDQPFADARALDVLAQSLQQTTLTDQSIASQDVAAIESVAEPVLNIAHGVVATSGGSVSGTTGDWLAPGSAAAPPFAGSITDIAAVDGSVTGIDAGDTVRLATALENTGGGGAFDVATGVTLPAGLAFANGSLAAANLQVVRGDGTVLIAGVDYAVDGETITFLDAGGIATLRPGRADSANDTSGANLVVITYDTVVRDAIEASRTLQSAAVLGHYASIEGGADFTPNDLADTAEQQVAAPAITKSFADGSLDDGDSSAAHTGGADLVIGERMRYDIVVTLPEGVTSSLSVSDLLPAGLQLDTGFNGGTGYQLITSAAGSGALAADFAGVVAVASFDGAAASWTFSAAGAAADNDAANNRFVLRVQLVAGDVAANQAGGTQDNSARLVYADPDGDTPNGDEAVARQVDLAGAAPRITVREPTLQIGQTLLTESGPGLDEGDVVEWEIVIRNGSDAGDVDAFDIAFENALPSQMSGIGIAGITFAGGATDNGGPGFVLDAGVLRTDPGANIDIVRGGSITLRLVGVVNATAAVGRDIPTTATVGWTSLDGAAGTGADPAGERTGAGGLLRSGALDDYRVETTLLIPVAEASRFSRVGGLPDTAAPDPTDAPVETVAVGELIRYRAVLLVPEGDSPDYELQIVLDAGLEFILPDANGNTVRIGFGANGPAGASMVTDADLVVGGTLYIVGNQDSPEAQLLAADLGGAAPTGVFDPSRISVAVIDGRQVVTLALGNISNPEDDADREGIVIEFNARVANVAAATDGARLGVVVNERVGGVQRAQTETLFEQVVEPSFSGLENRVVDFDPAPASDGGSATFEVHFTQDGDVPAYDTRVAAAYAAASGYALVSVTVDGVRYAADALPPGIAAAVDAGGLAVDFDRLDPGAVVAVRYQAALPNAAVVAPSDAVLTWSSLPESFTTWGGSTVGADGGADGERTGSGVGPNSYVLRAAAGLSMVTGTLWNDTASATGSAVPDGPALQGQAVGLTWAGLDGDLAATEDNRSFTTVTDANGGYRFALLPAGVFRIDAPQGLVTDPNDAGAGQLRVRIDSDGGALGAVVFEVASSSAVATLDADAGYVEQNDAPTLALPGPQNGLEDVPLAIRGITVADPDAARNPDAAGRLLDVQLSVASGTLDLSALPPGVAVSGAGSAALSLRGTLAGLNLALDRLVYTGLQDFNGTDSLRITVNDRGNFGDFDGNGTPGEAGDARSATAELPIVLAPVDDAPLAVDDEAQAREAGGTDNAQPGVDPRGGLLRNDQDVDIATNGDVLRVGGAAVAGGALQAVPPGGTLVVVGRYGRLEVDSEGIFQYVVDNANDEVQALRTAQQTLEERFDYVAADVDGEVDLATLRVVIRGANDAPVADDDAGTAVEAGGVFNGTPGDDARGNVLANDSDVDVLGERLRVDGVRFLAETAPGPIAAVPEASTADGGAQVAGAYGTLFIGADGSYRYRIDNDNPAVQALVPGAQLEDHFSYRVADADGLRDLADLRIAIVGANDNPVASDDVGRAQAGSADGSQLEVVGNGNVITQASRAGAADNGIDGDVDAPDNPNTVLRVSGIRGGSEAAGGALTAVAGGPTRITGAYGTLAINADGSYSYDVDSDDARVRALPASATLTDVFTYQLGDTAGLVDLAQLAITVRGANDPPVAGRLGAVAVERGGVFNATPGVDPSGNVRDVVTDPDGDGVQVTAIRAGGPAAPSTDTPVPATGAAPVRGRFGTLAIAADGSFSYTIDNDDARVQALRLDTDRLEDRFTFTVQDVHGAAVQGEVVIAIHGRNDNPVAVDDAAVAVEAGGTNDQTPGVDPSGNLLANDTDVDAADTRAVNGLRTGAEGEGGSVTAFDDTLTLQGQWGRLAVNRDGSYRYSVDNRNPQVERLRPGQSLADTFTYRMRDADGGTDEAQWTVIVRGALDDPIARDDEALAVEAGGTANGTPGLDPRGNVLANDSDVDDEPAGIGLRVLDFGRDGQAPSSAGGSVQGAYGRLTVAADGSYSYAVDNALAAVQALRTPGETLRETFVYRMQDALGSTSQARLTVVLQGANDNPVAQDDAGVASDQTPAPQATGNVLANDGDVDAGDTRRVVATRGAGGAGGESSGVNEPIAGRYGTLVLQADGRYAYTIDQSNPEVLAAAGAGRVLADTFTYTVADTAGGTDIAHLVIELDIAAPYVVPGDNIFGEDPRGTPREAPLPGMRPGLFVQPVVRQADRELAASLWRNDGTRPWPRDAMWPRAAGLAPGAVDPVPGEFVAQAVAESRTEREAALARFLAREGRVNLSADGLLFSPSLFTAPSFSAQLREAAARR